MSGTEKASIALDTRPRRCIPIFREIAEPNAKQDIRGPASFEPHPTGQKDKESWMAEGMRLLSNLHRHRKVLCLRGFGLSHPQVLRSDHQPCLCGFVSRRRVPGQDNTAEPALADRLHLSEGDRLGLVLSQHGSGRLQPIHHRMEALHHDEDGRRDRHSGPGAASFRL